MATLAEIRKELSMIAKISKITNAMKVVAISKISRAKNSFLDSIELNSSLFATAHILSSQINKAALKYEKNKDQPTLWILYTSSLGMAGSYNVNIFKKFQEHYKAGDKVIVFGDKGFKYLSWNIPKTDIIKSFPSFEKPNDFIYMKYITKFIYQSFESGKFSSIKIIYSKFKNTNLFAPDMIKLLPFDDEISDSKHAPTYSVPNSAFKTEQDPNILYERVIIMYLESRIYSTFLQSKLCEHLSRKSAMIEACNNEDKKMTDLRTMFNKKRQEKITSQVALLSLSL